MKNNGCPSIKVSASIRTDGKIGASAAAPVIKFIILLCGCLGSAFTFMTCVDTGVSFLRTAAVIIFSCAFFSAVFSLKGKYLAIASGISAAAVLAAVFLFRNEICAGMAETLNGFMEKISSDYREQPFIYITEPELSEENARIFFLFAPMLMCGFAAHSAVRWNSASGVCLATCVPVFSVLMFGLEPNSAAFFSVVVCWAAMFAVEVNAAESISDERFKRYSAYCGIFAAAISAVCIIAITFASKAAGYERPAKLNAMYDKTVEYIRGGGVQQVIDEIVTIAVRNTVPTGAINHGRLGEFDEISFDGRTVLEVTVPKSEETVYLRGFVGSVYTGSSWEQLPDAKLRQLEQITTSFSADGLSPLLLDGYNLKYTPASIPHYSFTVKNVAASTDCLYMPYNLVPESVSMYRIVGGSSFAGSTRSYIGQFYDPRSYYGYQDLFRKKWSVPPALSEDEAVYRQFVYENYLDIPESFVPEMIFNEGYYDYISAETEITGKSTLDETTVLNRKLYFIKKWLRDNCEYSLSAGKLPRGEDFINNFLENRSGSCSHFASAAVIMCRYAGIPARYAEGYVIKPSDFPAGTEMGDSVQVEVTDARGHAWAEIYMDGFGWYPIEFTSGYGNVRTAVPTETTVTETETETETEESESVSEEDSEASEENASSPQPQETQTVQNAETAITTENTAVPSETEVPEVSEASGEAQTVRQETEPPPTVGFGAFGIKGSRKTDIYYDLTWLIIAAAAAAAVPAVFSLRRRIISAGRRRVSRSSASASVLEDYRRFGRLMKLMKMPEQGDLSYGEYAAALSERSEMLGDGTAELAVSSALKASFGGGSVTREEADEMTLAVNSLAKRFFAKASRLERFRIKYLYCIL